MMSRLTLLCRQFWRYLGSYQKPFLRVVHFVVMLLVIIQILDSNGMGFTPQQQINPALSDTIFTWMHIGIGLLMVVLTLILTFYSLSTRGLRYFFPYLWGDFGQLKTDLGDMMKLRLPATDAKGIATCVQGLGLGALWLVVLSGLIWFVLWRSGSPWALDAKSIHKALTGLIEVYLAGHGFMALLHFVLWLREPAQRQHG
ncbi:Cytochrome b(N-terminal)/b6/petB [Edwardsiella hoshinae]|uniref:Cytochrome b(N-terminal)/b6/petB n=2 Tax=Edwardsiella hoshinae TaxID=93378 RepID=A0A376DGV9_9GAMM|nr:Cytochrome b(N-terminal)/b6/petB [Edwardsiella hoshinae]